jgi:predicted RNA polymerase sigma factor
VHDEAPTAADTDWPQVAWLYGMLERLGSNPVVTLNRAIAVAMVEGPAAGLTLLVPLEGDPRMAGSHRLPAVRAHLLERAGERQEAVRLYREAASRTTSLPEQQYLIMKAARLADEDV